MSRKCTLVNWHFTVVRPNVHGVLLTGRRISNKNDSRPIPFFRRVRPKDAVGFFFIKRSGTRGFELIGNISNAINLFSGSNYTDFPIRTHTPSSWSSVGRSVGRFDLSRFSILHSASTRKQMSTNETIVTNTYTFFSLVCSCFNVTHACIGCTIIPRCRLFPLVVNEILSIGHLLQSSTPAGAETFR